MKLIDLRIEEARAAKWQRGREQYGPVFIGHPLEELYEEILDGLNYVAEAERQGFPMGSMADELRQLCKRVRLIYRANRGGTPYLGPSVRIKAGRWPDYRKSLAENF